MFSASAVGTLEELSKNVQSIGRRIKSPKNDLNDLKNLEEALKFSARALKYIRKTEHTESE